MIPLAIRPVAVALLLLFVSVGPGEAASPKPALPAYAPLPAGLTMPEPGPNLKHYDFGELELPKSRDTGEGGLQQGEVWHLAVRYNNEAADPGDQALADRFKPGLLAKGWTVLYEDGHHPHSVLFRYRADGKESWLLVQAYEPKGISVDMVEVKSAPAALTLKPPAEKPEKIAAATGDFPYLAPIPGSKLHGGRAETGPMKLPIRHASGEEETILVGSGSITKNYDLPGVTTLQFVRIYRPALEAAGWTILEQTQGAHQSDAALSIHYGRNGRDIWGYLRATEDAYAFTIADVGEDDLGKAFAKDCHVALYGVLFDFDKASLKPESDAVLSRAAALLKKVASPKIEIQGHTDGVGTDEYNQTLSEARATSVVNWLTAHGIAADRLSAKGYGKTHPIASNDSDEGRAKNRRVEIADLVCRK